MNLFRFDYDLTFAVLMMNADGVTYSRFGTQDHTQTTHRMSIAGLKHAMRQVLAQHKAGAVDKGSVPDPARRYTLTDVPAFARSKQAKDACYHCHYASNSYVKQAQLDGKFFKDMVFRYPFPENIGVTLEVDRNNVVQSVQPNSPAAQAGVKPGDAIYRAGEKTVHTSADLQFALEPVADPGKVTLELQRGKALLDVTLTLPKGWRRSDVSWRPSAGTFPPMMGFWGQPLSAEEKRQRGIAADRLAIRANFMFPGAQWVPTRGGLQNGDVVVAVDGQALEAMNMRQFHSWFRLNHNVGDTVKVTVLRGAQRVELTVPCIAVGEE